MQDMPNPVLGFCKEVGTVSSLQSSSHQSTAADTMPGDESLVSIYTYIVCTLILLDRATKQNEHSAIV